MSFAVSPSSAVTPSPLSALIRVAKSSAPAFAASDSLRPPVRLDLNESTFVLTPEMRQRIGEVSAAVSLTGYPDGSCLALRKAACQYFGVRHVDGMAVGNGADLTGTLMDCVSTCPSQLPPGYTCVPNDQCSAFRIE